MSETNREILFRGKRVDNGEWIYGDLRHISDLDGGYYPCIVDNSNGRNNDVSGVPAVLSTVGRYTGLTDKNGTKIFEGDILRAIAEDMVEPIYAVVGYGKFNDPNYLDDDSIIGWYAKFRGIMTTIFNGESEGHSIPSVSEVVGNIHDNPELLETNNHETEVNKNG